MLLLEALDRLMKGRTTFIIAHRFSTIRNANKILMISDGRIVESGSHTELMNLGKLYSQFYTMQFTQTNEQQRTQAPLLKEELG
jgi:ABC-type multidrug transport system fused ATPase/permease subunit